jgi:signal transduction histidine kinase
MDKLLKPFTQLDSSVATGYEGAGLGLALVKELI